ncbi:MAG: histidine kinase [Gillisia sp.]
MLLEKFEAEKLFEKELADSQIEIREQTLKNVGWELHDNIGQLLSVAKMQLSMFSGSSAEDWAEAISEIKETVTASLQEVRALSKSLNNDVIGYKGLAESVKNEMARFQRLSILNISFETEGEETIIGQKDTIILFRILQEFFSNSIKHSNAKNLSAKFLYTPAAVIIEVKDDGVGFNMDEVQKNSGLINMQSRARLINAQLVLNSAMNSGTSLTINYPIKSPQNEKNDHHR